MPEAYYPEHEKLVDVSDHADEIGRFIDWLASRGLGIVLRSSTKLGSNVLIEKTSLEWCAMFYEIDLERIAEEKREKLRRAQEGS